MFNSIGWGEILLLAGIALIVFGPERLPNVAKDAARLLKGARQMAQGARTQLKDELGPEFGDIDLDSLNPKTFVRKHLLEGVDNPLGDDPFADDEPTKSVTAVKTEPKTLKAGESAPYDVDAT